MRTCSQRNILGTFCHIVLWYRRCSVGSRGWMNALHIVWPSLCTMLHCSLIAHKFCACKPHARSHSRYKHSCRPSISFPISPLLLPIYTPPSLRFHTRCRIIHWSTYTSYAGSSHSPAMPCVPCITSLCTPYLTHHWCDSLSRKNAPLNSRSPDSTSRTVSACAACALSVTCCNRPPAQMESPCLLMPSRLSCHSSPSSLTAALCACLATHPCR